MPFISGDLKLDDQNNGNYLLLEDVVYRTPAGDIILVPQGFQTDLRSTPALFSNIVPKIGDKADKPSVLHDWFYGTKYFNWIGICSARLFVLTDAEAKAASDDWFLQAMTDEGDGYFDRYSSYWGVRLGGQAAWDSKTPLTINANRLIYKQRIQLLEGA